MQKAYLATNFQRKKEQFDTIFSAEAHETLRKRGLRRFSLKALQVKFSEKASKFGVKFIYSEKATKFCEIFTLLLTGTT